MYMERSGLVPVPNQEAGGDQMISPALQALASTAGCVIARHPTGWVVTRKGKSYFVARAIKTFDDWRATLAAVVETTNAPV
jgi:hypothetical protein